MILPDVRGLHPFFEELAMRFAERGIEALAIDYFGRTAPDDDRGEGFEYMPHVAKARWEHLAGDIRTAVAHLRALPNPPRSVFTTGFCMGGRLSSMSTTLGLGLAGAIPFYGWPTGENRNGTPAPAEVADKIESDLLIFYGENDEGLTKDVRDDVRQGARQGRGQARDDRLPGRPARLLRPTLRRVRRRFGRRLGQDAGVHPPPHDGPADRRYVQARKG